MLRQCRATVVLSLATATLWLAPAAHAQLVVTTSFNPETLGSLCSLGFGTSTDTIWLYACSGSTVEAYDCDGAFQSSVPRPGESANDVDIELAPEALTLNRTALPAGTLLFLNGESGTTEIYALDARSGAIIETLDVAFGSSHVVGGAYHPQRDTFFVVQDRNGGVAANVIVEIDPETGNLLNSFSTIALGVDVNFGDLDVDGSSGNLLVVSSIESTIAEFSPEGDLVQEIALPAGVTSLSGIGIDDQTAALWVCSTTGVVWRLERDTSPCPDLNADGSVGFGDLTPLLNAWGPCLGRPSCPEDLDGSDQVGFSDLQILLQAWGPCA